MALVGHVGACTTGRENLADAGGGGTGGGGRGGGGGGAGGGGGLAGDGGAIDDAPSPDRPGSDARTDGSVDRPPPVPNPEARRLVEGRVALTGGGANGCTRQSPEVWCSFYRASAALGRTELWVINVTAASSLPGPVKCTTGDQHCRKLTDNLWTETLPDTGTGHPNVHAFVGDTLVYQADATSAPARHFRGRIYAWRPGWSAPQQISSINGYSCVPSVQGRYGYCLDNVDETSGIDAKFVYLAGPLASGAPPFTRQDDVVCCEDLSRKYSAQFTPDERYFVWSGRHALQEREAFYFRRVEELAAASTANRLQLFSGGESRLSFTADGRKMLYLRAYNYNISGAPAGQLMIDDFPPAGAQPQQLEASVGAKVSLGVGSLANKGLVYFADVTAGRGRLWVLRDTSSPASKKLITSSACQVDDISTNLERVMFAKTCDGTTGLNDQYTARLDPITGTAAEECALTDQPRATTWGLSSLTSNGRWTYWADRVDTTTFVGDGMLTDNTTCTTRKVGSAAWAWDPVRDQGFVDNVDSDGVDATIRVIDLRQGGIPASLPVVQNEAAAAYALPGPGHTMLVYTVYKGLPTVDGLWVYQSLPFGGGPAADGGGGTDGSGRAPAFVPGAKALHSRDAMTESPKDRRTSPRFPTRTLVEVKLPSWDALRGVYMTNVSVGGMRLSVGARPPLGVSVDVILTLPDGRRLHLAGKVAHLGPDESGDIGVKLEGLLPKTRQEIQEYVDKVQAGSDPGDKPGGSIPSGVLIKKTT